MKLLFIYGSPAVGKLTVAKEIAKQTGYKVFHNHLSIDCIEPIFDFGSESFFKLIEMIRIETVAEAARRNVNLIYTFCYAKDSDDAHVRKITETVEANGGEICFVLLTAEKEVLKKRVLDESRKQFGKISDLETLHEVFDKYDLFSPVPERESLVIDNTNLSPEKTARKIIGHFQIQK
ncbi:MAG TPA: AAA family ATPase [Pyrinomonadaceae bacterium]|nr:AAA family ATPase [Pyrinomonadaceae bacterium]